MSQNILHVENVTMQFGGVVAVNNLSLDVNEGDCAYPANRGCFTPYWHLAHTYTLTLHPAPYFLCTASCGHWRMDISGK